MSGLAVDWKLLARDRFAVGALAGFVICVVLAAGLGYGWAERHRAGLDDFRSDARFTFEGSSVAAAEIERPIVKPPAPLLDLTIGRTDLEPATAITSFFAREDGLFRDYQFDGPLALSAGRFDLAFVVVWLAPLLLIALGLSIVSADRDTGLLRMQAAASGGLGDRALARAVLRWSLVFGPIALVAVILATLIPPVPDKPERLVAWLAAAGVYLMFWQATILFASSYRLRQETLGAALLGLWALLVLVVPALASGAAQALYPPPSRFALVAEARAVEVASRDRAPELLNEYMHDHPELAAGGAQDVEAWMKNHAVIGRRVEAAIAPTIRRFEAARAEQRRVSGWFELLSPALLSHRLLADAAGSGEAAHAGFQAAARAHHRDIKQRLVLAGLRGGTLPRAVVEDYPAFTTPLASPAGAVGAVTAMAILALLLGFAARQRLSSVRALG